MLATLLYEDLYNEPSLQGITILRGLLDQPGILGNNEIVVDRITPDYDIIDITKNSYLKKEYKITNAYITSTTKGCIRKCKFLSLIHIFAIEKYGSLNKAAKHLYMS